MGGTEPLDKTMQKSLTDGNQICVSGGAVITGRGRTLWTPAISNTIRQMDQSAPGLDRAKSSRSCDQWISVNPTERGRRLGCISPHASLSLPFEHVSLSLSL